MGSGFLLLTVGQELPKGTPMKYFGQELNITTYNLARMNLMMHSVSYNNMVLNNADTLESDWSDAKGIDNPRSFDAVVAIIFSLLEYCIHSIRYRSLSTIQCM
ncbi:hypothetical protein CDIOL_37710 [Clostridium diolis]|uniref:site-specific DNA-methyltransferase (adenine-specific) n=1 Tax=Clostridium diolis TaxID=223919 RepID=A0AAV3W3C9_9CLOT|nr:hypothetical protein CDIOL_37710 [Clostridium diolis]